MAAPSDAPLKPAAELAQTAASKPYPNDSAEYRRARTALLAEEIELRRHIARVAAMRRALPPGGEPPAYRFVDADGRDVGLSDLFGQHDTLITYFWMYGPQRERPCPMCTSFLGSIDIPARDLTQRVALAVIGRSPVSRQLAFARERGWRNLAFYQCVGDDFARDVRGLADNGDECPALDVWTKESGEKDGEEKDGGKTAGGETGRETAAGKTAGRNKGGGKVRHFWAGESAGTQDPGQDPHGAPEIAPLWNLLDLTPGGRGQTWYPKLADDGN